MKNLQELINVHIPVMSAQVLEYLNLQPGGLYIDGTIGAGGHAAQILSKLSNEGKLIGIDRDAEDIVFHVPIGNIRYNPVFIKVIITSKQYNGV